LYNRDGVKTVGVSEKYNRICVHRRLSAANQLLKIDR